jgi:hypothetical protein
MIETDHPVPLVAALGIDGLMSGNSVEPRAKPPSFLKLLALEVHLEKGRLKNVFRHLRTSEIPAEIVEQLNFVTVNERLERRRIAVHAKTAKEILVGDTVKRPRPALGRVTMAAGA